LHRKHEDFLILVFQDHRVHYNNHVKINFDALESRLKSLVESSTHLISSRPAEDDCNTKFAYAVQTYLQNHLFDSEDVLPELLILDVAEKNLLIWQNFQFNEALQSIFQNTDLTNATLPQVTIVVDSELLDGEIVLRDGAKNIPPLDKTASMPSLSLAEESFLGDSLPANAFVIVNGLETFQLTKSVVNIGRRLDNDLVIEDTRISREHAQIRAVKGQYVIFDLNSTGGTFVNSVRISQQPLFPGDVISLSGVPLVYGQDNPPAYARTGPVEPFYDPSHIRDKP
jgi:hypothetical protein